MGKKDDLHVKTTFVPPPPPPVPSGRTITIWSLVAITKPEQWSVLLCMRMRMIAVSVFCALHPFLAVCTDKWSFTPFPSFVILHASFLMSHPRTFQGYEKCAFTFYGWTTFSAFVLQKENSCHLPKFLSRCAVLPNGTTSAWITTAT